MIADDDARKDDQGPVPDEPEGEPAADEHYKVGYRRPPLHGRFKAGRSGNAKGRPKGRRNAKTILDQVLRRRARVRVNGQVRIMPSLQAMLEINSALAMKGDPRAFAQIQTYMVRSGYFADEGTGAAIQAVPEDDAAIIENYLRRKSGRDPDGSSDPEQG